MSRQLRIIERYLGWNTIAGFLLVISLLGVIFSLFELLIQLDYVGYGNYGITDAFVYVVLTIPKRLSNLMPMAALLGSIAALGMLADHHELTAMQLAGLTVQRIALTVLATSTLLMLAAVMVSEFIAPPLDQYARIQRFKKIYGNNVMLTRHGFWTRHGNLIIHVDKVFSEGGTENIKVFEFNENGLLRQFVRARQGRIESGKDWLLSEAEATVFTEEDIAQKTLPEYRIEDFLSPSQVALLELPADSLSLSGLHEYIRILEHRGQNAERYALAFWQKICLPLTSGVMVLLSLTFVFGSTRMRNAWQRISMGMLAGTFIYLLNQIFGQLSLVLHLPPLLMTLLPAGAILLVALRLLRRAF
jgi:lipopolysaccharide export system permease protein